MNLPIEIVAVMSTFTPLFSARVWEHAQVLIIGTILAVGKRTVTTALGVMGKKDEKHYSNYHRVLNRDEWSSLAASGLLLKLIVRVWGGSGPLVFGIDDTIERRGGEKIKARGIYRDPVRSSHSHFVKASGLRWLSMMIMCLGQHASGQCHF